MSDGRTDKGGVGNAGAAAVVAGAGGTALGYLIARQRAAQSPAPVPGSGVVSLDDTSLQILATVADNLAQTAALLNELLGNGDSEINGNYGVNQPYVMTQGIICAVAGQNYQLPSYDIPEGHQLVIKALSTNTGLAYVTSDPKIQNNPNSSYPLLANEAVTYRIKNTSTIYIAAAVANEGVSITVEQPTQQ